MGVTRCAAWLALLCCVSAARAQVVEVDAQIPPYQKAAGIRGNASSMGSDTMNNLMALWLEGFQKHYPGVRIQIEGKGSSTAPPALIEGTAQFGPMSRPMKATEVDRFEEKYGYEPVQLRVALDALAVFVNKDNPVEGLSLPQVDAIFSKTRRGGLAADIVRWGDLGLTGDWATARISLYGRNSASGTYGFFKEEALFKGDYKDEVKEQPGSASVVQGVTEDRFGVGYSGIGYRTSGVRPLPLARNPGEPFEEGTLQNVLDGSYPLGRFLYLYINKAPGRPLEPLVREFCRYVLSREGQQVVVKDGYMPVPASVVQEELARLEK
ncbi:MAG: phosphate ABC transporter substrate-binding protein [Candidatus Latescibacterota bacterium]